MQVLYAMDVTPWSLEVIYQLFSGTCCLPLCVCVCVCVCPLLPCFCLLFSSPYLVSTFYSIMTLEEVSFIGKWRSLYRNAQRYFQKDIFVRRNTR
jgi:hypothetical protein